METLAAKYRREKGQANTEEDDDTDPEGATGGQEDDEESKETSESEEEDEAEHKEPEGGEEEDKEEENKTEQTASQKDHPDYIEKVIIASDTSNTCKTLCKNS